MTRATAPSALAACLVALAAAAVPAAALQAAAMPAGPAVAPALPRVPPPTDLPRDRPLRAGFLVLPGVDGTELMAAYDVLQQTVRHARPGIEVFTVSPDGAQVRTAEGLVIDPRYGFSDAPALDVLVVPSAEHNLDTDLGDDALLGWLTKTGQKARFVLGLSRGAFLLARANVVQTRLATTSLADQDAFTQMFPKQELRRDVSFVHDGPLLTSVGGARSYDAALYLVDHLYGEEVARQVASGLVIPWPPGTPQDLPALVIRYRQE
jgi:transcriptional regulator GlxA family with amidase domain